MSNGLEGVVAAETALSDVNGERGELILAGAFVEDLAGRMTFEDVVHLLGGGGSPERVRSRIGEGRALAFERLGRLGDALDAPDAMSALRAGLAHFAESDFGTDPAAKVAGAIAMLAAAFEARRRGASPSAPEPSRGLSEDLLRLVRGRSPSAPEVAALDAYLVTVIDHGMNASTFAARVVASTGSDLVSALCAAIGALKGPLHGGAPGPVLDMLDAIGRADASEAWLVAELAAGRRIMGMGHRIYRVRDPRAFVLERAIERLERETAGESETASRLALARAVERSAERLLAERHSARALRANVEFYTAVLLEAVGVPRRLFSAIFAVSRSVGWTLHVAEQKRTGRLIRPASRYVGLPVDRGRRR